MIDGGGHWEVEGADELAGAQNGSNFALEGGLGGAGEPVEEGFRASVWELEVDAAANRTILKLGAVHVGFNAVGGQRVDLAEGPSGSVGWVEVFLESREFHFRPVNED